MYLLWLFDESAICTCLQDLQKSDLTVHLGQEDLVNTFKKEYAKTISTLVNYETGKDIFISLYADFLSFLPTKGEILVNSDLITWLEKDRLTDTIYTLGFWMWKSVIWSMEAQHTKRHQMYTEMILIHICAILRETLFGYMLYITSLDQHNTTYMKEINLDTIQHIYIRDVLMIDETLVPLMSQILWTCREQFAPYLTTWISLDDNASYLALWRDNREHYSSRLSHDEIVWHVDGEDIVRFRSYLKHISYYNTRYIVPKRKK